MTLSQRDYKKMKKDVDEYGAYGIGFWEGIESQIPLYVWVDVTRKIGEEGWIRPGMTDAQIKQLLITESIRHMNFQDFKRVASYLFNYPKEQHQEDALVRPVEVSRAYFEELQTNAQELFNLKRELTSSKRPLGLDDLISQIEQETLVQDTGFEVIGISQDRETFLVLDNRLPDRRDPNLGDIFLENDLLINDYRKAKSDQAQILDAILQTGSQKVLDYVYTFYNDNYREATGDLEGLEAVANYLVGDGLSPALLDEVETTSQMWQIAQESDTFKQDYKTLDAFLDDYDMYDYMMDNASQIVDYPEHIAHINDLLEPDHKAIMVQDIRGYNQGDFWTLGALYDPTEWPAELVADHLTHEVAAAYRGNLTQAILISKEDLEAYGLDDAVSEGLGFPFDEERLWGKEDKLQVICERYGWTDFMSLEQAMTDVQPKRAQVEELELGR